MKSYTLKGGPWTASMIRLIHDSDRCAECRQRPPVAMWNQYLPVCLPCADEFVREIERKRACR